jgi:hypothetical protein
MGARIKVEGRTAMVDGGLKLTGAPVNVTDLRSGAALIIAAMAVRADAIVDFLQRLTSPLDIAPLPIVIIRPHLLVRFTAAPRRGVSTHWSIRGPPLFA